MTSAAAVARVRQAQASAVIAGAPLLPEIKAGLNANRQKLLRGKGYSQLDVEQDKARGLFRRRAERQLRNRLLGRQTRGARQRRVRRAGQRVRRPPSN